jgi:hypothetical protein
MRKSLLPLAVGVEWRWALIAVVVGFPAIAQASLPVPYAIVGCVQEGHFASAGAQRGEVGPRLKWLDGKTIRVEGQLSPGDRFRATAIFVVDTRCRADLHRSYLLCNPCRTLPNMGAPSKILPPQGGTKVPASPADLRGFDR